MAGKRTARRVSTGLKLAFPVVVLSIVLAHVDLRAVLRNMRATDPALAFCAFLLASLIPIFLSAWRWQWTLRRFYGRDVSFRLVLREYWIALFVGHYAPPGLGVEVCRVVRLRSASGGMRVNAAVIFGEKIWTLATYALLVVLSYPLVAPEAEAFLPARRVVTAVVGLFAVAATAVLLLLLSGYRPKLRGQEALPDRPPEAGGSAVDDGRIPLSRLLSPLLQGRSQAIGLLFTVVIQLVIVAGGRFFLSALGVSLPFIVHIFVWSLLGIVLHIPVTVAGLGMREASLVLLFGLFGVARETALAASFLALACTLIAISPGGVLLFRQAVREAGTA